MAYGWNSRVFVKRERGRWDGWGERRLEIFQGGARGRRDFSPMSATLDFILRPIGNHWRVWAWSGLVTMDIRYCLALSLLIQLRKDGCGRVVYLYVSQLSIRRANHNTALWAFVQPGGFGHHRALAEAGSGSPCLLPLQSLFQGRSLWSESWCQPDKLAQFVVFANLVVWFGSLSQPPSQKPLSLTRETIWAPGPQPQVPNPREQSAPQWANVLLSQVSSYRKRATVPPWLPLTGLPLKLHPLSSVDQEWKSQRIPKRKKEN